MSLNFFRPNRLDLVTFILLFFVSAGFSFTLFILKHPKPSESSSKPSHPEVKSSSHQQTTPANLDPNQSNVNILLLGHGDAGHQGGDLTDAILVAHFNTKTNLFALISIPRDLWVNFPDGSKRKINAALARDPQTASVAKQVVSTVTGMPIDYFVSVNFFGFTAIIDELNGIDVHLPHPVQDQWYPVRGKEQDPCDFSPEEIAELTRNFSGFQLEKKFTCRYEQLDYPQGPNHINGTDALKISRSRHSGSDFARSQRQQAILIGIKDKLLSLDALTHTSAIYQQLQHTFSSDIDLGLASALADLLIDLPHYQTKTINLSTNNVLASDIGPSGQFILLPKSGSDWSSVHRYLSQELSL